MRIDKCATKTQLFCLVDYKVLYRVVLIVLIYCAAGKFIQVLAHYNLWTAWLLATHVMCPSLRFGGLTNRYFSSTHCCNRCRCVVTNILFAPHVRQ